MIMTIAYIATVGVLGSYALSIWIRKPRIFDYGNAIFFLPLTFVNLWAGASWAAMISFTFGVIACVSLFKAWNT